MRGLGLVGNPLSVRWALNIHFPDSIFPTNREDLVNIFTLQPGKRGFKGVTTFLRLCSYGGPPGVKSCERCQSPFIIKGKDLQEHVHLTRVLILRKTYQTGFLLPHWTHVALGVFPVSVKIGVCGGLTCSIYIS